MVGCKVESNAKLSDSKLDIPMVLDDRGILHDGVVLYGRAGNAAIATQWTLSEQSGVKLVSQILSLPLIPCLL
jgi:hypothetical protein